MFSALQLCPLSLKARQAALVCACALVAVVQRRKLHVQRLVAGTQMQPFCHGDVLVQISAVGNNVLVVYRHTGETQVIALHLVLVQTQQFCQATGAAEINHLAVVRTNSRVPIELLAHQPVVIAVTRYHLRLGVQFRESVVRCYPQHAVLVLSDSFHRVVRQSLLHGVSAEHVFAVVVSLALVQSVLVAAYP